MKCSAVKREQTTDLFNSHSKVSRTLIMQVFKCSNSSRDNLQVEGENSVKMHEPKAQTDKQRFHDQTTELGRLVLLFWGQQQILEHNICSSFKKIKDLMHHPYIEVPLPYIDRRPLTYLVSPSAEVNLKKNNPWSVFLIFGPPCFRLP